MRTIRSNPRYKAELQVSNGKAIIRVKGVIKFEGNCSLMEAIAKYNEILLQSEIHTIMYGDK